jgi:hypothetical protein
MQHDVGIRLRALLLVAFFTVAVGLLVAVPALAQTKQALVNVQRQSWCCQAGTPLVTQSATTVATVGTTTPTPSIYIPSKVLTRNLTTTWTAPLTPYSKQYISEYNAAATFRRSHPLAPTATTTAAPPTSTTQYGSYFMPRYGTMIQTPGPNRFGGTMRIVDNNYYTGQYVASVGYYSFDIYFNATPRLTGPRVPGQYGWAGYGALTHTSITYYGYPLKIDLKIAGRYMPSTTGVQYVYQPNGYYITQYTSTGYDNRTPSGLSGTVSMVAPYVLNYVQYIQGAGVVGTLTLGFANRLTLTFLPEPGRLLMLGCGILALAGLYRLRIR